MQGKDTLSPRSFSFLDPIDPSLVDQEFRRTPIWRDAPLAPVVSCHSWIDEAEGLFPHWSVIRCPWCGGSHMHRAFDSTFRKCDPRAFIGGRKAHCGRVDSRWWLSVEYRLVGIEWKHDPDPQLQIDELDAFFPLMPASAEAQLPHSHALIHVKRITEGRIELIDPNEKQPAIRQMIARDLRSAVWRKTNGRCWYCGVQTDPFDNFHVDHVQPVSDGGTNDLSNLVPSCQRCNNEKHAMPVEVFRQRRGGGLFWFEIARNGGDA